ncbi:hypothetical protein ABL78_8480, partial [Leptomonas seymouri]
MNDDYFVNRDVAITDLFNEYGGTIVRTDDAPIKKGEKAGESISWAEGVANTELFNIQQLEHLPEDHLPASLARHWGKVLRGGAKRSALKALLAEVKGRAERLSGARTANEDEMAVEQEVQRVLGFRELLLAANNSFYWEAALESPASRSLLPEGTHVGVRQRFLPTHAPFVYCTNMFRHFSVRFEAEFAPLQLRHRERMARDLFMPFVYNGFILARPWEASAQWLPYALELHEATRKAAADTKANLSNLPGVTAPFFQEHLRAEYHRHLAKYTQNISIYLDNEDGCAPATLYRNPTAEVVYVRATNNMEDNRRSMDSAMQSKALYFNINAGFTTADASNQVREFLRVKFPTPTYMEKLKASDVETAQAPDALTTVFDALMQL